MEFRRRRDFIVERLSRIPSFDLVKPKGAFYVFPSFTSFELSSSQLVKELLKKKGVRGVA